MNRSTSFTILAVLLVCAFVGPALAQRGGSRSSSSRSSSSHHSSSHYGHTHHSNQNCTTVNGTRTCTYTQSPTDWTTITVIIAIFGAFVAFAIVSGKKDEERRATTIEGVMKTYEARMEEWPSVLDQSQKSNLIDAFMKKQYTMVINVRDNAQKFYCQVKVLDLKKENDYKYKIKLSGSDEVGKSQLDGILIFRADGIGLKLSKVYDDRQKAEQTGSFDLLFYEGAGNADNLQGQWAFHGHETSTQHAGSWKMLQI